MFGFNLSPFPVAMIIPTIEPKRIMIGITYDTIFHVGQSSLGVIICRKLVPCRRGLGLLRPFRIGPRSRPEWERDLDLDLDLNLSSRPEGLEDLPRWGGPPPPIIRSLEGSRLFDLPPMSRSLDGSRVMDLPRFRSTLVLLARPRPCVGLELRPRTPFRSDFVRDSFRVGGTRNDPGFFTSAKFADFGIPISLFFGRDEKKSIRKTPYSHKILKG